MKSFKIFLLILISFLIIWIDLPENFNIRFKIFNQPINLIINPLKIDTQIFGLPIKKEFKTQLGLDLKGGSHLVFEAETSNVSSSNLDDALQSTRDIIEKRVNFFGVSEPQIQTIKTGNKYKIAVDLPGITNVNEAINLIGKTAQLSFKEEATVEAKIATTTPIFTRLTKELVW